MIQYDQGKWGVNFIFQCSGTVLTKAMVWSVPCSLIAMTISLVRTHVFEWEVMANSGMGALSAGYMAVLGFLLVFRTQIGYSRFWDGASYLQTIRAGWFNVCSSCFAFCSAKEEQKHNVRVLQHQLVRLTSMLYCAALQELCQMNDPNFELIELNGLEEAPLVWIKEKPEKCEIVMQWIQRLIVDNHNAGTINIAPPILSRVFQELANGIIDVSYARRIKAVPFPFPYSQAISIMLLIHSVMQTAIAGCTFENFIVAGCHAFITTLAFWSINYIAVEIEMPYGDDCNDLPLREMQRSMNQSLLTLLDRRAQTPPLYDFEARPQEVHFVWSDWTCLEQDLEVKANDATTLGVPSSKGKKAPRKTVAFKTVSQCAGSVAIYVPEEAEPKAPDKEPLLQAPVATPFTEVAKVIPKPSPVMDKAKELDMQFEAFSKAISDGLRQLTTVGTQQLSRLTEIVERGPLEAKRMDDRWLQLITAQGGKNLANGGIAGASYITPLPLGSDLQAPTAAQPPGCKPLSGLCTIGPRTEGVRIA